MRDKLTEQVETLIMPSILEMSADLIELNVRPLRGSFLIDIIADRPQGGITLEECASINRKVDRALANNPWFGENYSVSVASPGLDRPLRSIQDFMRGRGRLIRVHLTQPIEGKMEHHGLIKDVGEQNILLKTKDKDVIVPYDQISKAARVIE